VRKAHLERDPAQAERNAKNYDILKRSVARLGAARAHIILGSDTGLEDHFFGYAEQKEIELMVQAGMSPSDVIVAATSRAAAYLGLADRGVLSVGRRADILVLDGNPLDDIRNTRRIARFYLAGAEVDRAALKASLMTAARN
jgi:imidazolonepropionase-like amidohydrolase